MSVATNFDDLERLSRMCKLLEKILSGTDYIAITLEGYEDLTGQQLRIKGKTLYYNGPLVTFEVPLPISQQLIDSIQTKYNTLKQMLKDKASAVTVGP